STYSAPNACSSLEAGNRPASPRRGGPFSTRECSLGRGVLNEVVVEVHGGEHHGVVVVEGGAFGVGVVLDGGDAFAVGLHEQVVQGISVIALGDGALDPGLGVLEANVDQSHVHRMRPGGEAAHGVVLGQSSGDRLQGGLVVSA